MQLKIAYYLEKRKDKVIFKSDNFTKNWVK